MAVLASYIPSASPISPLLHLSPWRSFSSKAAPSFHGPDGLNSFMPAPSSPLYGPYGLLFKHSCHGFLMPPINQPMSFPLLTLPWRSPKEPQPGNALIISISRVLFNHAPFSLSPSSSSKAAPQLQPLWLSCPLHANQHFTGFPSVHHFHGSLLSSPPFPVQL
ncbi:hypothetical protein L7F22_048341 [Adiantum nelumboides]|nr:hypothetical protein [Adiantum nelumboides]